MKYQFKLTVNRGFLLFAVLIFSHALFFRSCNRSAPDGQMITMATIGSQVELLLENVQKSSQDDKGESGEVAVMPRTINEDGSLRLVKGGDWTSGFFPGILWYMKELTGDEKWIEPARKYTAFMEKEMYNASNHDVGFRMFCSYGNGLRLEGDPSYVPVLVQSAKTLVSRYYEKDKTIRSWDFNQDHWQCPVIIDNMMNLELLFWATRETGDSTYHHIAVQHALTTLANHFREDHSSYHVVDYDTITGEVRLKVTHQGYADSSAWARGQAWGLYGFTMAYRYTGDPRFLHQAEAIAGFILDHPRLPEDGVPYWDFDAPGIPDVPRDVSAAAVIASALYELSTFSANGERYRAEADRILESLGTRYVSPPGENYGFILDHSVGSFPARSEVDVPLIYADYYFLEALDRKAKLKGD